MDQGALADRHRAAPVACVGARSKNDARASGRFRPAAAVDARRGSARTADSPGIALLRLVRGGESKLPGVPDADRRLAHIAVARSRSASSCPSLARDARSPRSSGPCRRCEPPDASHRGLRRSSCPSSTARASTAASRGRVARLRHRSVAHRSRRREQHEALLETIAAARISAARARNALCSDLPCPVPEARETMPRATRLPALLLRIAKAKGYARRPRPRCG